MSMQPQTCITPPQSYRKAAEEMFGHVVRVGGVQSLTQCSTNGANGGNSIRAPASQRLDNNASSVVNPELRVKTAFRSSMTAQRMSGLTLLHVHRDLPIDIAAAVDEFSRRHPRRMQMVDILSAI